MTKYKYKFQVYRYPKNNVKKVRHIKTYHSKDIKNILNFIRQINYRFKKFRYTVEIIKNDN